jgi:hypothetical protein
MARYTVSVTATIESSSLLEGRCDAERMVELLTNEFFSVAYNVELREPDLGNTLFEETSSGHGREHVTFH